MMQKPPEGWSTTDERMDTWRVGFVFRWATGFNPPKWLQTNDYVTIKPQETGAEAYRRQFGKLPPNIHVFWRDV